MAALAAESGLNSRTPYHSPPPGGRSPDPRRNDNVITRLDTAARTNVLTSRTQAACSAKPNRTSSSAVPSGAISAETILANTAAYPNLPTYQGIANPTPSLIVTRGSYPSSWRALDTSACEWRTSPARKSR